MSRNFVFYFSNFLQRLESLLPAIFPQGSLPPAFALAGLPSVQEKISNNSTSRSLKDLIGDGILWAVPKHRRSVEKRLKRKFGYPEYNWKLLRVKTHLRSCNHCGHDYEAGHLCPHCYNKVREETKEMQDKIQEKLGLNPVEQDVVVLYEGERSEQPSEMLNGKRIVEMPKPRPIWFTKNLLQKTTQQPSNSKEVKPNDLA
ncbi:mitochondrial ribosomal protein L32 [Haematobia irritans]|uniref:Large ribosomal subunit protein bL32m n=1 Tax=Haematobia irritans TaxID=7368 RepID=A0A1L8EH36_HAEIR